MDSRLSTSLTEINRNSAIIDAVRQDYLPSKRIGILIIAIVILALGVFFYTTRGDSDTSNLVFMGGQQESQEISSDGRIQDHGVVTEGTDGTPDRTTNLQAQILPRALYLAAARESGEDISEEDIARVAGQLDTNQLLQVETYSETDLNTVQNASRTNIEQYIEETVRILSIEESQERNPLSVIAEEIQDGQSGLINLSEYITQMETVVRELREVPVPIQYADDHIVIVNSTSQMKAGLEAMEYAKTDPLSGVLGGQLYRDAMRAAESAAERLAQRINEDVR